MMSMETTITEQDVASFWNTAEPEDQDRIALSSGVKSYNLKMFAPLYTWWKYCNKKSQNRLRPFIVAELEKKPKKVGIKTCCKQVA